MALHIVPCLLTPDKYGEYEALSTCTRYGVNLHPFWFSAYVEAFGYATKELLLEARDARTGALCGLLALLRKDSRESRLVTLRRLVPLGYRPTDFFDILSVHGKEDEVTGALASWLRAHHGFWDRLVINLIPITSRTWRPLVSHLTDEGLTPEVSTTVDGGFFRIDTTGSYDQYLRTLGTKKLKDTRYYQNKLARIGKTVRVEHLTDAVHRHYEEFEKTYADRRLSRGQSNPFRRAHMPQYHFMRAIVSRYGDRQWVRLSLLKIDDTVIAYSYNLIYRNVIYYSMPAFVENYRLFAPGKVLLAEMIKDAFADPDVHEFNFMRSEFAYKAWFVPARESYVRISVANPRSYRNRVFGAVGVLRKIKGAMRSPRTPARRRNEAQVEMRGPGRA